MGDEYDLGTPSMDSISIISASLYSIENRYFVMTAFGSEGANKEVSHAEVLERISELTGNNGFLGVSSLLKNSKTGKEFMDCGDFIFKYIIIIITILL